MAMLGRLAQASYQTAHQSKQRCWNSTARHALFAAELKWPEARLPCSRIISWPGDLRSIGLLPSCRFIATGERFRNYDVMKLREDGTVVPGSITSKELLSGLNVRDLRSLTAEPMGSRRSLPLLLPRRDAIVMSIGHIKALIHPQFVIVFNAHEKAVKSWVEALSSELCKWHSAVKEAESAFELLVLESALKEVTDAYQQRVRLYHPVVTALLTGVGSSAQAVLSVDRGLRRVLILKESLSDFQQEVRDLLQMLTHVLENDEDMLGLLITQLAAARARGEAIDDSLHAGVEVLLEDYHRHLTLVENEAVSMMRNVKSRQELAAIAIDLHRSRLVRVDVYMGILTLGAAVCTTIAGYVGMNVPIIVMGTNLEANQAAFMAIVAGSSTVAMLVMLTCVRAMLRTSRDAAELRELRVLHHVFQDLGSIDYALKTISNPDGVSKADFREALVQAKNGRPVPQEEVDMLFDILDRSGDGLLQADEIPFTSSRDEPALK